MNFVREYPQLLISTEVGAKRIVPDADGNMIRHDKNGVEFKVVELSTPKMKVTRKMNPFTGKMQDVRQLLDPTTTKHLVYSHDYTDIANAIREKYPDYDTSDGGTSRYVEQHGIRDLNLTAESLFHYEFSEDNPIEVGGAIVRVPCAMFTIPAGPEHHVEVYSRVMYIPFDVLEATKERLETYVNNQLASSESRLEIDEYINKETNELEIPDNVRQVTIDIPVVQ